MARTILWLSGLIFLIFCIRNVQAENTAKAVYYGFLWMTTEIYYVGLVTRDQIYEKIDELRRDIEDGKC